MNPQNPRLRILLGVCVVCVMTIVTVARVGSSALPMSGVFAESSVAIDGAVVRRVRDRDSRTVCYVATAKATSGAYDIRGQISVAISCVPERGAQ